MHTRCAEALIRRSRLAALSCVAALVACAGNTAEPSVAKRPAERSAQPGRSTSERLAGLKPLSNSVFAAGACGGFEQRAPSEATSLLEDRLTIEPFAGLVASPRPHDAMSAPESEESETRLFLAEGEKAFVVFVEELFKRPSDRMAAQIRDVDPHAVGANVGGLSINGLDTLAIVPRALKVERDKALALRLYVVMPDELLVRVSFYVSPDVAADGAGCSALAKQLADTLTPAGRVLDLAGGKRSLEAGLSIEVPKDVAFYEQPGPDFVVYHALPITKLGAPEGNLHVYVGGHPQQPVGTPQDGTLLGRPTQWFDGTQGAFHAREALIAVPGKNGTFAHVFFGAEAEQLFASLERMATTLK